MSALSPYLTTGAYDFKHENDMDSQQTIEMAPQPFVCLLELVSEIYQVSVHPHVTYCTIFMLLSLLLLVSSTMEISL